jgi:hypothetical protein
MRIARSSLGKIRDPGFAAFLVVTPSLSHPAAGQGQFNTAQGSAATTAFDGEYVGTATLIDVRFSDICRDTSSVDMTIAGGQVLIHADYARAFAGYANAPTAPRLTFQGSVNAAGEISTWVSLPSDVRILTGYGP